MPVAEAYNSASHTFSDLALAEMPRTGHAAVLRSTGEVLVLGGLDANNMPLASGFAVDPGSIKVTDYPMLLSVPRAGATATIASDVLLVCGGTGANGKPIASCDLLDEKTLMPRTGSPLPLAAARTGHTALLLESGMVMLLGGVGGDGNLLNTLEVYAF
jgi:hypothetical protein